VNIHKRFTAKKTYPRLDHFLVESLPDMSRSQIAKLIKENKVKLNNEPVKKKSPEILADDVVEIEIFQPEKKEYHPSFEFKKLYEDQYLLIIDKPAGIPVHKGAGEDVETILDVFRYNYPRVNEIKSAGIDADAERPGIVHRLDRDTSGILLLAKDIVTMRRLQKQFKRREVRKTYLALVSGHMRYRSGTIDAPIVRSPRHRTRFIVLDKGHEVKGNAREAITDYYVIREYRDFSYVRLSPHTGRTHQLRVHLSHAGNPILGDRVYGKATSFERLALHAYSIEFTHPITGLTMVSYSPFPPLFREFIKSMYLPS
jgi:23S rRNA pseudouridine1911/1915/1917 synthase